LSGAVLAAGAGVAVPWAKAEPPRIKENATAVAAVREKEDCHHGITLCFSPVHGWAVSLNWK
jgi:hypothetical protein